jgi:PIN domain
MVKALFDTSILIDYLNAVPESRTELQRYQDKAVSIITWMEVMVGADDDLAAPTRNFLSGFDIVPLDEKIAERAVSLRRSHRIKLPDAVIWQRRKCAPCFSSRATPRTSRPTIPGCARPTGCEDRRVAINVKFCLIRKTDEGKSAPSLVRCGSRR